MSIRVLVTSIGTGSGVNVLKALRRQQDVPVELIGTDVDPSAAGLRLADRFYLTPRASSPDFIPEILKIAQKEKPLCLLPTFSGEIEIFAENQALLRSHEVLTLLPSAESVLLCNDKKRFGEFAAQIGVRVPRSYFILHPQGPFHFNFPVFVKPVVGSGNASSMKVDSAEELQRVLERDPFLLVQEYIVGTEVTVDVFTNSRFEAVAISPRLRLSVKGGQSVKGKTVPRQTYEKTIKKLCRVLRLVGTSNFQFMITDSELVLIEINPRYAAGGLMLTVEAGINTPLLVLKEILGMDINPGMCEAKSGVMMSKYWEEVFWSEPQ